MHLGDLFFDAKSAPLLKVRFHIVVTWLENRWAFGVLAPAARCAPIPLATKLELFAKWFVRLWRVGTIALSELGALLHDARSSAEEHIGVMLGGH